MYCTNIVLVHTLEFQRDLVVVQFIHVGLVLGFSIYIVVCPIGGLRMVLGRICSCVRPVG